MRCDIHLVFLYKT